MGRHAPRKMSILVVDDDAPVATVTTELLKAAGYDAITAESGAAALAALADNPGIDLLFTDISMPGMHGFMLADIAKERHPRLKVIYATGYAAIVRELRRAGEADSSGLYEMYGPLVYKPYWPADLRAIVHQVLTESEVTPIG